MTAPDERVKPVPAHSISPASFVKLNAPVDESYDKSPVALNNRLICEGTIARSIAASLASSYDAVILVCGTPVTIGTV